MKREVFLWIELFQTYELSVITKLFTHSSLTFTCSWTDISTNRYNLSKNNHIDLKVVFSESEEHSSYKKMSNSVIFPKISVILKLSNLPRPYLLFFS